MRITNKEMIDKLMSMPGVTVTGTAKLPVEPQVIIPEVKAPSAKPGLANAIIAYCHHKGLLVPVKEHRFAWEKFRRAWRFDLAWIEVKLALEIQGIGSFKSRHTTFSGFSGDCEKMSHAAILGWRVLLATCQQVEDGSVYGWIEKALTDPM